MDIEVFTEKEAGEWKEFAARTICQGYVLSTYARSTPEAQLLQVLSGLGTLATVSGTGKVREINSGIADIAVGLINYAHMTGTRIDISTAPFMLAASPLGELARLTGLLVSGAKITDLTRYMLHLKRIAATNRSSRTSKVVSFMAHYAARNEAKNYAK